MEESTRQSPAQRPPTESTPSGRSRRMIGEWAGNGGPPVNRTGTKTSERESQAPASLRSLHSEPDPFSSAPRTHCHVAQILIPWGKPFKSTTIHPLARSPPCPSLRAAWAEGLRPCATGKGTVFLATSSYLLQDSAPPGGKEEPLTNVSQGRKQQN